MLIKGAHDKKKEYIYLSQTEQKNKEIMFNFV